MNYFISAVNSIMNLGWLTKSFIVLICFLPFPFLFSFFGKGWGMKSESLIFAWNVGAILGMGIISFGKFNNFQMEDLYHPLIPLLIVVSLGFSVGTLANILYSQVLTDPNCPNLALPLAIMNSYGAWAYILAPMLAIALPKYFNKMVFTPINFIGIILVIIGMILLMYKNKP